MNVDGDRDLWLAWADKIHRRGFEYWVATFLESLGPLTLLGAQFIYAAKPLLGPTIPENHLDAAARLMEDPRLVKTFTKMLRENPAP